MWMPIIVALVAALAVSGQNPTPGSSSVSSHNETDRSLSSFSITDLRPSKTAVDQPNGSDARGSQASTIISRVKRQQSLPTSEEPDDNVSSSSISTDDSRSSSSSSSVSESTSMESSTLTDSIPTITSSNQPSGQDKPQGRQTTSRSSLPSNQRSTQPYPTNQRFNMQPLREDPRLSGPAGIQPQSGQYSDPQDRSAQRNRQELRYAYPTQGYRTNPTRRPATGGVRGSSSAGSYSRYPPRDQGRDQQITDSRYRDRDSQTLPQQSSQNIALEIELLRFSNERALLANNRPCDNKGVDCSYQISGNLESGDSRNRARSQQKMDILTTPPKSDSVDILMKTRIVLCGGGLAEPATLRLDVKTADPSPQRRIRQARLSSDQSTDFSTIQTWDDTTNEPTRSSYNPDADDEQNRIRQPAPAEDQYSRDRYGDGDDAEKTVPQQGRGVEDRRSSSSPVASGPGGELVNSFDCVINLANAGNQQAHTSQWQTLNCRPQFPNSQMELMFRYNAYTVDPSECGQSRPDLPLSWTPLAG